MTKTIILALIALLILVLLALPILKAAVTGEHYIHIWILHARPGKVRICSPFDAACQGNPWEYPLPDD